MLATGLPKRYQMYRRRRRTSTNQILSIQRLSRRRKKRSRSSPDRVRHPVAPDLRRRTRRAAACAWDTMPGPASSTISTPCRAPLSIRTGGAVTVNSLANASGIGQRVAVVAPVGHRAAHARAGNDHTRLIQRGLTANEDLHAVMGLSDAQLADVPPNLQYFSPATLPLFVRCSRPPARAPLLLIRQQLAKNRTVWHQPTDDLRAGDTAQRRLKRRDLRRRQQRLVAQL